MKSKTKYLKYLLHIAVLAGIVWAAAKYVNGQEVIEALQSFDYTYLPFLLVLSLVFFLLKAWRFAVLMAPFTDNLPALVVYKVYTALGVYSIVLYLTLQGFDLSVSVPVLLLSVILPTMLGRVVPIPGGLGVTEASMVGFLTGMGQLNTDTTVAAVAIFRIATIVFPATLGALVYFFWWRGEDKERERADEEANKQSETTRTRTADASGYPVAVGYWRGIGKSHAERSIQAGKRTRKRGY